MLWRSKSQVVPNLISQLLKYLSFSGIYEESDHPVNSPSLASKLLCDLRHRTAPLGCAVKSGETRQALDRKRGLTDGFAVLMGSNPGGPWHTPSLQWCQSRIADVSPVARAEANTTHSESQLPAFSWLWVPSESQGRAHDLLPPPPPPVYIFLWLFSLKRLHSWAICPISHGCMKLTVNVLQCLGQPFCQRAMITISRSLVMLTFGNRASPIH